MSVPVVIVVAMVIICLLQMGVSFLRLPYAVSRQTPRELKGHLQVNRLLMLLLACVLFALILMSQFYTPAPPLSFQMTLLAWISLSLLGQGIEWAVYRRERRSRKWMHHQKAKIRGSRLTNQSQSQ